MGAIIRYIFPELYPSADKTSHIDVVDDQGRIVYGEVLNSMGPILGRQFGTTLYKWRLNVTMTAASDLAAAVARRHVLEMVMVGLSGLVVIAGSIVILVAAARERKLSNRKSDFVANVSHELKTPLSLVRMFGELLQSGRVDNLDDNAVKYAADGKRVRGDSRYRLGPGHCRRREAARVRTLRPRPQHPQPANPRQRHWPCARQTHR